MLNFTHLLITLSVLMPEAQARRHSQKVRVEQDRSSEMQLTSPPQDNETCFAPDEACTAKLIKFILSEKNSLDIAIFELTDRKIAEAIVEVAKKSKVRMIVNRKLVKDEGPAYDLIKASPAEIRVGRQRGIMHDKFTVVDGKRLETGSFNYTYAAGNSNQENQIYLSTPSIVSRFNARFEQMWKEAKTH